MNSEFASIVDNMLGGNNEFRQQAEQGIKKARAENAQQFLEQIIAYISEVQDDNKVSFAMVLLKKLYLDDRPEEQGQWQMTNEQVVTLKNTISQSINFASNSINILRRKADIICKCFRKLETYEEMMQNLVQLLKSTDGEPQELVKKKQFAMYNFEVLSEYHLSQDLIVQHSAEFIQLFT